MEHVVKKDRRQPRPETATGPAPVIAREIDMGFPPIDGGCTPNTPCCPRANEYGKDEADRKSIIEGCAIAPNTFCSCHT